MQRRHCRPGAGGGKVWVMGEEDGKLIRMAILLALQESPRLGERVDELERRVAELVALGEREMRRRGLALRRQRRN